ncbi:MAG: hypothetical protein JXX14_22460 [Deltaproteobacteria bacterium]|nr:hypothetical protein [Deltaproteobacteria bacterium]
MKITALNPALFVLMCLLIASCKDDVKNNDSDGTDATVSTDSNTENDTSSQSGDTGSSTVADTSADTGTLADTQTASDSVADSASDTVVVDTSSDTATDTQSSVVDSSSSSDTIVVIDTASDTATSDTATGTETASDTATDSDSVELITPEQALDSLITVFCEWEFGCCTPGERAYRLGTGYDSVENCVSRLSYELYESNDTNMPLNLSASPMTIVPQIAYSIDLNRVEVNAAGVAACAEWLGTIGCNIPADLASAASCQTGVSAIDANPCALTRMFSPGLVEGDVCTNDTILFEGSGNDIECEEGTSCVPPGSADNAGNQAMCVNRGLEGDPCTMGDDNCDFGLYCADGWCAAKADVDEPCAYAKNGRPVAGELSVPCKLGLTCNPALDDTSNGAGICVAPCSTGSLCTVDSECPDGQSCAPISVGNDSNSFFACRPLGSTAAHRCDSHADCIPTSHCTASGVCAADAVEGGSCQEDEQCPEATYCAAGTCTVYTLPGDVCTRSAVTFESPECGPDAAGCIYDATADDTICSSAKLINGEHCLADYDCASGLCEQTTVNGVPDDMVCYAGAREGDACDDIAESLVASQTRCAPGLACDSETNLCYVLATPGDLCEAEAGGAPDDTICATTCTEAWGEYLCDDGPVEILDGGTGVICDGAE